MLPFLIAALGEAAGVGAAEGAALGRFSNLLTGEGAAVGRSAKAATPKGLDISGLSKTDQAQTKFDALFDKNLKQQLDEGEAFKKRQGQEKEQAADRQEQYRKDEAAVAPFVKAMNMATFAIGNRFVPLIDHVLPGPLGKLATAVANVTEAFVQRGHELARFSGKLSAAEGITQTQDVMADLRESQAMEGPLSRMMLGQNEVWLEIRDLLLPIKRIAADKLADFIEVVGKQLGVLVGLADTKVVRALFTLVELTMANKATMGFIADTSTGLLQVANAYMSKEDAEKLGNDLEGVFRKWLDADRPAPGRMGGKPAGGAGLGIPLFA